MTFGSPEFVLAIIGMAMFAGVMKFAIAAKHGVSRRGHLPWMHGERTPNMPLRHENPREVETLRSENKRLIDQVEAMQDRLIVLEKIVTDRGYGLASEIEALRDRREVQ